MKIAFLGLGNMGMPMARHLIKAKHDVTVWNRTSAKAQQLVSEGARIVSSAGEAGRNAELAITMLADDHAVIEAVLGRDGLADTMSKSAVHVSMSTISVALSEKLEKEHSKRGQLYVAAPVFGRPDAAEAGKLFIAAAGMPNAVERAMPVLELLGQRVFVLGDRPEMANVVKVSGNFLIASVIECLGEAVVLARKYGIDPHSYVDFLTSTLFAAPVYKTYGALIADERYHPPGFRMRLGLKDVRLALAAGEAKDAALPVASLIRDHMLSAISRGMAELDWSATAKLAAENAGLE